MSYAFQDKDDEVDISYVSNYNQYEGSSFAYEGSDSICGQMKYTLGETDF